MFKRHAPTPRSRLFISFLWRAAISAEGFLPSSTHVIVYSWGAAVSQVVDRFDIGRHAGQEEGYSRPQRRATIALNQSASRQSRGCVVGHRYGIRAPWDATTMYEALALRDCRSSPGVRR